MRKSRHEWREERRERRQEERTQQVQTRQKAGRRNRMAWIGLAVLLVVGIGYIVTGALSAGGDSVNDDYLQAQLTDIPAGFVHWHADLDIVVCGEERQLPEATPGGLIGDHRLHTHDRVTNQQSLAASDGNGVIHNEGDITLAPRLHTLGRFMDQVGARFSNTGVYEMENGDACPDGTVGQLTVTVNDQVLEDPENYIPRDGDKIVVTFGGETKE